jgi:ribosome biogenesis protein Nip4
MESHLLSIPVYASFGSCPTAEQRAAIEGLVRRLLDARGQGPQASAWEAEPNRWVYQVYGLSAGKIGVVEREHHG